jgi:hypothetical protein
MRRCGNSAGRLVGLLALSLTLSSLIAGCGDDDVISVGNGVTLAVSGPVTQVPGTNILCVPFTATGVGNDAFAILLQYALALQGGGFGTFVTASEINGSTPGSSSLTSASAGNLTNGTFSGTFYWDTAADLGPFGGAAGQLQFVNAGGGGTGSAAANFSFAPAAPTVSPGGGSATPGATPGAPTPAPGSNPGRAAHDAYTPGATNVVVAGGRNDGTTSNAFPTVDRFNVDLATLQYSSTSHQMGTGRTDHASSFFLDPATNALKLLVTGGATHGASGTSAQNTANVYCFTPTEQVTTTSNTMNTARAGHTATWAPRNKVYIIGGGATAGIVGGSSLAQIEAFDPATNLFSTTSAFLNSDRRGHTATLLPNGYILIAGGFSPFSPTTPLGAELFDTATETMVPFTSTNLPTVDMVGHTATRLANGWVLLAGGRSVANPSSYLSFATVFLPETGVAGDFTATCAAMAASRALHSAVLLGDGTVLLAGGDTAPGVTTSSAEIFLPNVCAFSSVTSLSTPRAEHSSTALANGTVVVVAGRNGATFLESVETFPSTNALPVVTAASLNTASLSVSATDGDGDGGYVIGRARVSGSSGAFTLMRLTGNNGRLNAGVNNYTWNFAADGFTAGQTVEIQLIPVGATFGAPFSTTSSLVAPP